MKSLLKRISAALLPADSAAAAPLTADQFTTHFTTLAGAALHGVQLATVKPLHVRCTTATGATLNSLLDNSYALYLSDPASLEAVLDRHIAALSELAAPEPQADRSIFAVLKPATYLATVQQQLAQAGHGDRPFPLVFRPILRPSSSLTQPMECR